MQFDIRRRYTGEVIFTADIECGEEDPYSVKLGCAVRAAHKKKINLSYAYLSCADLRGAILYGAKLRGADLSYADLRYVYLSGADLRDADLYCAELIGADLRDAILGDVPIIENIHQRVYAAASKPGGLRMRWRDGWGSKCGTRRSRAGWVVALAGEEGKDFEKKNGTGTAAALIYAKSDPTLECIPDWFASEENALADMKRLAEREKSNADIECMGRG